MFKHYLYLVFLP